MEKAIANYKKRGLFNLLVAAYNTYLYTPLASELYPIFLGSIITDFNAKATKATDKVEFAMSYSYLTFNIKPVQNTQEINELLNELRRLRPKNILEIGTYKGGTLYMFATASDTIKKSISIGLPATQSHEKCRAYRDKLLSTFTKNGQTYLLSEDSHSEATVERVREILGAEKLDFVFIDGEHSYESVEKDFHMYLPLVREGGIMAFHDITDHNDKNIGVYKLWEKIKKNYNCKEISYSKQGNYGIGVVYIGQNKSNSS